MATQRSEVHCSRPTRLASLTEEHIVTYGDSWERVQSFVDIHHET